MWLHAFVALSLLVQAPDDPEARPEGRESYLGREVARTMHWRGAPWLLRETREKEENGARLREWLAVRPGDAVCDLGCGNGYHTLPLAEAVGPKGKMFAVDLQPEMLDLLAERAEQRGIDNLVPVVATVDDPRLPANSTDLVLMVDVYHELSHPVRVLGHLRRALKENGRVVLVEFRAEDRSVPIKPRHKMTKAQVIREMSANGFTLRGETDALPWQHAMAFGVAKEQGPRAEPRALAQGLLDAASGLDARILEPYLAPLVDVGEEQPVPAREFAVFLGEAMGAGAPPVPRGTRIELEGDGADDAVRARLYPPTGTELAGDRRELRLTRDAEGRWQVAAWRPAAQEPREHGSPRAFAAMHTGLGGQAPAKAAATVQRAGLDGIACDLGTAAALRAACEASGMDVFSTYAVLDLDGTDRPGFEDTLAQIEGDMTALEGGPGMVWLAVRAGETDGDEATRGAAARAALVRLARHAEATGVEIALYPHTGFWLATTEQAIDLAAALDEPRVGVCFNLCHYLRRDSEPPLAALLERAAPRLFAVTVNGADVAGEDWRSLIQPLGDGDHDLGALLDALDAVGFRGPVGLQAFGVRLPPAEHLARSMGAWRAAHAGR